LLYGWRSVDTSLNPAFLVEFEQALVLFMLPVFSLYLPLFFFLSFFLLLLQGQVLVDFLFLGFCYLRQELFELAAGHLLQLFLFQAHAFQLSLLVEGQALRAQVQFPLLSVLCEKLLLFYLRHLAEFLGRDFQFGVGGLLAPFDLGLQALLLAGVPLADVKLGHALLVVFRRLGV
jgi:hypothetical protein